MVGGGWCVCVSVWVPCTGLCDGLCSVEVGSGWQCLRPAIQSHQHLTAANFMASAITCCLRVLGAEDDDAGEIQ